MAIPQGGVEAGGTDDDPPEDVDPQQHRGAIPTAPYVLDFLATRCPIQYVVIRCSTSTPIAMKSAPGTRARGGVAACGSLQDVHHQTANEVPVMTSTVTTAPATPVTLRTSLRAIPTTVIAVVTAMTVSLGKRPRGFTAVSATPTSGQRREPSSNCPP